MVKLDNFYLNFHKNFVMGMKILKFHPKQQTGMKMIKTHHCALVRPLKATFDFMLHFSQYVYNDEIDFTNSNHG